VSFSYIAGTDIATVRLLIMDTNAGAYVFEDAEITVFLGLETGVKRAAALALEVMASNEAFTLKVIRLLDLQTDGAKTADALMKRAATLRSQAEADDAATDGGAFDVAEWAVSDFAYRGMLFNQALRG
jgi:hypothetical protein